VGLTSHQHQRGRDSALSIFLFFCNYFWHRHLPRRAEDLPIVEWSRERERLE
jgi:hypothetical protein